MTITYSVEGIDTDLVLDVRRAIEDWAEVEDVDLSDESPDSVDEGSEASPRDVETVAAEDADVAIYLDTPISDVSRSARGSTRLEATKDTLDDRYDYCDPDHRIINTRGRSQNQVEHIAVNAIITENETK